METLEQKFPDGKGLKCLLLDACYDEDDDDEKNAFKTSMRILWNHLDRAKPLQTVKVQEVATESKQLKKLIEEKDNMLKAIEEKK